MKIIECPRDAMQGVSEFIPTDKKIAYINQLLKVGFAEGGQSGPGKAISSRQFSAILKDCIRIPPVDG